MADAALADFAVHLRPADNVAVARKAIPAGTTLSFNGASLRTAGAIPLGHKFAVAAIREGDAIGKYGQVIGFAAKAIAAGEHVHTHNVSLGSFQRDYAFASETPAPPPPAEERTFLGFDRGPARPPHQRYGTRNYIAVIS